jgi:hypothetical protein
VRPKQSDRKETTLLGKDLVGYNTHTLFNKPKIERERTYKKNCHQRKRIKG